MPRLSHSAGAFALILAGLACMPAPAGEAKPKLAEPPAPVSIDRNGVLILIRSTLLALDHANKSGNYTVLRDLGAPGFQANSDARLAEIFAAQRRDNLDLSGVAVLEPQLTLLPQIDANGIMRMAGFFPSVPSQVNFELTYAPVNRQWRLFGISVALGQSGPVAPSSPETPPAAAAAKTPQAHAAPPAPVAAALRPAGQARP
jgi:hypothetical protein